MLLDTPSPVLWYEIEGSPVMTPYMMPLRPCSSWVSSSGPTPFKNILLITYFRTRCMEESGADVVGHWTARRCIEVKFPGPSLLTEALQLTNTKLVDFPPSAFYTKFLRQIQRSIPRGDVPPPRLSGGIKKYPAWRRTLNNGKCAGKEAIVEQCSKFCL